jgi:protein ImuA
MRHSAKAGPDRLARLRARIASIERIGGTEMSACPLGVPAIDDALPWGGLPRGALHEISGLAERDQAAQSFAAVLLGLLAQGDRQRDHEGDHEGRPVLWIAPDAGPYAPALPGFGLDPAQLTTVRARRPADALWALEEAVRCPALAAVLAEGPRPDFAQSRRLQLAATESGVTALLLQPATDPLPASAAVTRWRVGPAMSGMSASEGGEPETVGYARWRLDLLRCRGGRPRSWLVEWNHETHRLETHRLAVAADARDRSDRAPVRHPIRHEAA